MPKRKRHRQGSSGSTLTIPSALWRIDEVSHTSALVDEIFSDSRYVPLIVISSASDTGRPRVDVDALVATVGEYANVAILTSGSVAYALSDLLSDELRVYGGATRLYWPNAISTDSTSIHPLFLTDTEDHSPATIQTIIRALIRAGYIDAPVSAPATVPWQPLAGKGYDDPTKVVRDALSAANCRIAELTGENATLRKQVHGLTDQVTALEERLHSRRAHTDPAEQLRHEIHLSWLHTYSEADRAEHPLAPYSFGEEFVDSVESITGIERDKIVTACVDVLIRRAWEINGRQARQMRATNESGSPIRVRVYDGATAWRCNLQTNTASARRLMWWEIPGGAIELAVVALHDNVIFT